MKKTCLLLSFAVLVTAANASFELLLAPDRVNKRVSRVDPATGAYFGSFGTGYLNQVYGVAVNAAKSEAYVSDDSQRRLFVFNYNTGEYLREFSLPGVQVYSQINVAANGDLLLSDYIYGGAYRVSSANGSLLATFNTPAGASRTHGIVEGSGGEVYITWSGIDKVARYTNSGGVATSFSTVLPLTANDAQQATRSGSAGIVAMGQGGKLLNLNLLGGSATAGAVYDYSSIFTRTFGVAFGHGEQAYVSGDLVGGGTGIGRFNRVTGVYRGTFTIAGSGQMTSLAIINAPEPATWVAMALGALALVRARRR